MGKISLGYHKGMNRDISKNMSPVNSYYYGENIRILSDGNSTEYSLVNINGNDNAKIDDNSLVRSNHQIIGSVSVLDDIVLFYASTTATGVDSVTETSIIDILEYLGDDNYLRKELVNLQGLNFRIDKKIKSVSTIETDSIRKVYWTDNNNLVRFINVDDPDLSSYTFSSSFELNGLFPFDSNVIPEFDSYTSGQLKPGTIQYALRFIKQHAQATVYCPASNVIPLSSRIRQTTAQSFRGDEVYSPEFAHNTGIGVRINLNYSNPDVLNYYDYIEVVSLWYSSEDGIPDINTIYKGEMVSSIIDDGSQSYGTVDYGEFLSQQSDFVAKDLEIKDERLFVANTKDKFFDLNTYITNYDPSNLGLNAEGNWEARAYRWSDGSENATVPQVIIYDGDNLTTPEYKIEDVNNLTIIPTDSDCINIFNNITSIKADELDPIDGVAVKYKQDGVTIGGEGINISYKFKEVDTPRNIMDSTYKTFEGPDLSGEVKWYNGIYKGYQRDEIYRFAIEFFDPKGRQSFADWVGDIRFPNTSDTGFSNLTSTVGNSLAQLTIEFTVTNIPVGLSWRIVRLDRTRNDRSVVSTGLSGSLYQSSFKRGSIVPLNPDEVFSSPHIFLPTVEMIADGLYSETLSALPLYSAWNEMHKRLYEFRSPDIKYNKDYNERYDYIEIAGIANISAGESVLNKYITEHSSDPTLPTDVDSTYYTDHLGAINAISTVDSVSLYNIDAVNLYTNEVSLNRRTSEVSENKNVFEQFSVDFQVAIDKNYVNNSNYGNLFTSYAPVLGFFSKFQAVGLKTELIVAGDSLAPPDVYSDHRVLYVYARRAIFNSQYGGYKYEDRVQNKYIPASNVTSGNTAITSYRGDIVINYVRERRASADSSISFGLGKENYSHDIVYLAESTFNGHLKNNNDYYDYVSYPLERSDVIELRDSGYTNPTTGIILDTQNQYNLAYNHIDTSSTYFVESNLYSAIYENPTKISYSQNKYGNEDIDQFTIFRPNDYYIIDKDRGDINKLISFYDTLFTFQDTGLASLLINPNAVVNSSSGELSLGSGAVIQDVKYITENIGCQDNSNVIKSQTSMYWLDINKKKIYSYSGQLSSVTDSYGLHSFLKTNVDENSEYIGVYDFKNSEVLMTVLNPVVNNVFLLSEIIGNTFTLTGDGINRFNILNKGIFIEGQLYELSPKAWFKYTGTSDGLILSFLYISGLRPIGNTQVYLDLYINEKNNFTVSFNEKVKAFTSFYSFLPTLYVGYPKGFMTTTNNRDLYQHGINKYFNSFYGVDYPTTIKWNIGLSDIQGDFNNITFYSEVFDYKGDRIRNLTMTNVSAMSDHRYSEDIQLYPLDLPESGGIRNRVYTSGLRVGIDYVTGLLPSIGELVIDNYELYRSLIDNNPNSPTASPSTYERAELGNIRKTISHWGTSFPRIPEVLTMSDRIRSDWVELTLQFKDVENLSFYKVNLKNINVNAKILPR